VRSGSFNFHILDYDFLVVLFILPLIEKVEIKIRKAAVALLGVEEAVKRRVVVLGWLPGRQLVVQVESQVPRRASGLLRFLKSSDLVILIQGRRVF
jgi:hypothetical protein